MVGEDDGGEAVAAGMRRGRPGGDRAFPETREQETVSWAESSKETPRARAVPPGVGGLGLRGRPRGQKAEAPWALPHSESRLRPALGSDGPVRA